MAADDTNYSDLIDRRRFIELAGVSGAAALAGCGGDGSGQEGTDTGTGSSDGVLDVTHVSALQANPMNRTINPFHTQLNSEPASRLAYDRYASYSFENDEFSLSALKEWKFDKETVTLTFRDDLKWSNGDKITTEDIDVQFKLLKKTGSAIWGYVESTKVVDDVTYQLNLTGPTNPQMVKFQLSNMWVDTPASEFKQFLDKPASAVQTYEWEDKSDNIVTSAGFKYSDRNQQEWTFKRNDQFRKADNINFKTYKFDAYQEASVPQQDFTAGGKRFDSSWSMFAPPATVKGFKDYVVEIKSILAKWGYGMIFNHKDPIFGDRAVRQAIAHVVNRESLVQNAGPRTKFPASVPCGIAPKNIDDWLGDKKGQFESYGVGSSQTKKAATILEDAGYTKQNGTWQNSSGKKIKADYLSPAGWSDYTTMTNTVVDQLNQFGFDLTVSTKPTSDWQGSFINSNFKIGTFYWLPGQSRSTFPYFPLRHQLALNALNGGHNYPTEKDQTIPAMGGNGEMTLNPLDTVNQIGKEPTREAAKPIVQKAAWHNNYDLPMLSLVGKFEQSWLTKDEWNIVEKGDPDRATKWPPFWLPREGKLTAKKP